ncbi:DNA polymerase III subunit beta [Patescibacteria group bacterium]|nr:DNA polymerase III subunit beta [Patescibacteria group bacterium]
MIINLNKKEFRDVVGIVSRFADKRSSTLPTLSGIALIAGDDGIKVRATNLETGVDMFVEGTIKTPGAIVIPSSVLRDISSSFSDSGQVTIEHSGDTAIITAGTAKSTVKTLPFDDFPSLPLPENPKTTFRIPGASLVSLINTVASCASTSTIRPELAAVLLSSEGGHVKAVATDSFRLAEKKISIKEKMNNFSILIPARNALDLAQTIPDTDVEVRVDEHQCAVVWGKNTLTTRLVAAAYPDYTQIIPKSFTSEATVLRKDFEGALKRTAVFSDSFQKVRLGFDVKGKKLALSAHNADVGEAVEPLASSLTGDSLELSFNFRYLQTPLPLFTSESITLSAGGIGRPLVIKGVGDQSFLYLVMPMNQ